MENQIQIFEHKQFGTVRTLTIDGVVWFVAADVCRALELTNPTVAVSRLDNDERAKFNLGQPYGNVNCVNEPGLYRLIFASRKKEAKDFQRWVYHEVLPSIRKTGSYSLPNVEKAVAVENTPPLLDVILSIIPNTAKQFEEIFKLKHHSALFKATVLLEKNYGVDLSEVKKLIPAFDPKINYYSPTQLGEIIAKEKKIDKFSSHKVNKKLIELGFQTKVGKVYVLTEAGKNYGKAFPYENNGHSGYQVKWKLGVMEFFK